MGCGGFKIDHRNEIIGAKCITLHKIDLFLKWYDLLYLEYFLNKDGLFEILVHVN